MDDDEEVKTITVEEDGITIVMVVHPEFDNM